jgi:REP element-mobilizing transposase RayT
MNKYNPNIHHRRSIRLKGYDYAQAGLYFITICCQDRLNLFGDIENGEMKLNIYGEIAWNEWQATEKIRNNTAMHEFIVMPDHIHGIIEITFSKNDSGSEIGKFKSPSQTVGAIIRGYKIATIKKIKDVILNSDSRGELQFAPTPTNDKKFAPTKEIIQLDFKIWQRNYYEHIIRNEHAYNRIARYIINNPVKWDEDKFYLK